MQFRDFIKLTEAKAAETGESKRAVFTFGRFNPPTKGHEKLINAVVRTAGSDDHFIFPSHTKDVTKPKGSPTKNKNPIDSKTKVNFMQHMFPQANIVFNEELRSPFHILPFLGEQGYTDLVMVVGSDRVPEFQKRMDKATEYFDSFEVVSAGARDPDSDDAVSAMSATKAREAALENDIAAFRVATGWDGDMSRQLMDAVQQGLKKAGE